MWGLERLKSLMMKRMLTIKISVKPIKRICSLILTLKKRETQTILIKLLGCEGLDLTTPITCLIENALYLAENTAFIVGDIEMSEVLENLKDKGVEKISMYMPAISNDNLCLELGSNLNELKLESGDLKIRG